MMKSINTATSSVICLGGRPQMNRLCTEYVAMISRLDPIVSRPSVRCDHI
jgi:hypothetical protein